MVGIQRQQLLWTKAKSNITKTNVGEQVDSNMYLVVDDDNIKKMKKDKRRILFLPRILARMATSVSPRDQLTKQNARYPSLIYIQKPM
jgi:hypothetical protein